MKTIYRGYAIIYNIKNRLTKLIEAVRYHYINYKVDIHHFGIEVINLSDRVHDIEEMITETIEELNVLPKNDVKYFKSMLNCSDIKQALEDVIFSAMSSEYAEKTILNKVPETNTTDDHKLCVPQTPAQRLTNNILNYYGGDWNVEDFNKCFEIVNKYDIKNRRANKKGGK